MPPQGPQAVGHAICSIHQGHAHDPSAGLIMCAIGVGAHIPDAFVQTEKNLQPGINITEVGTEEGNRGVHSPTHPNVQGEIIHKGLPTPINIARLEQSLLDHPDRNFVTTLCNNLKYGADIGFTGSLAPHLSRNLPTALAQPAIVSENLANEVALGRVEGPFFEPPFPNFQVSPIGLVPKKHTNKFRTIFHLSYHKSGVTSINHSISKED